MPTRSSFLPVAQLDLIDSNNTDIIRNGTKMDSKRNAFEEYMKAVRAKIPRLQTRQHFDHHQSPESFQLVPSSKYRLFGIEKEIGNYLKSVNYKIQDVENQINFWHNKKTAWEVNSLKLDIRHRPYLGVYIYKKTGATAGQLITLNLIEMEMMVELLSSIVLPGIKNAGTEETKLKTPKFEYQRSTISFVPIELNELGLARDRICKENCTPPNAEETLRKIESQKQRDSFYENGDYTCESIEVHASKMGARWFIGLYKREGFEKHQSVWFSAFEAQWLTFYLAKLYKTLTRRFEEGEDENGEQRVKLSS